MISIEHSWFIDGAVVSASSCYRAVPGTPAPIMPIMLSFFPGFRFYFVRTLLPILKHRPRPLVISGSTLRELEIDTLARQPPVDL